MMEPAFSTPKRSCIRLPRPRHERCEQPVNIDCSFLPPPLATGNLARAGHLGGGTGSTDELRPAGLVPCGGRCITTFKPVRCAVGNILYLRSIHDWIQMSLGNKSGKTRSGPTRCDL
uniref:(northern house mosquito) hypothetical protein n=1 Tax=Culex pipiens TaxID=7175 RepID=A0A8D8L1N7_CULPI